MYAVLRILKWVLAILFSTPLRPSPPPPPTARMPSLLGSKSTAKSGHERRKVDAVAAGGAIACSEGWWRALGRDEDVEHVSSWLIISYQAARRSHITVNGLTVASVGKDAFKSGRPQRAL